MEFRLRGTFKEHIKKQIKMKLIKFSVFTFLELLAIFLELDEVMRPSSLRHF